MWRIRASDTRLVCAAGSRNGTEDTKLLVLDFDLDYVKKDTDLKWERGRTDGTEGRRFVFNGEATDTLTIFFCCCRWPKSWLNQSVSCECYNITRLADRDRRTEILAAGQWIKKWLNNGCNIYECLTHKQIYLSWMALNVAVARGKRAFAPFVFAAAPSEEVKMLFKLTKSTKPQQSERRVTSSAMCFQPAVIFVRSFTEMVKVWPSAGMLHVGNNWSCLREYCFPITRRGRTNRKTHNQSLTSATAAAHKTFFRSTRNETDNPCAHVLLVEWKQRKNKETNLNASSEEFLHLL